MFTLSAVASFSASGAMHLGLWHPTVAVLIRRLDHACIFVALAGSYTAFTLLMLTGRPEAIMLFVVWGGAVLGISMRLLRPAAPRWLYILVTVTLGWSGAPFLPHFVSYTPTLIPVLMILGLFLYASGGLVYALRRPNPWPAWFGFHEVFHALTIAGFATQYVGVLIAVCRLC